DPRHWDARNQGVGTEGKIGAALIRLARACRSRAWLLAPVAPSVGRWAGWPDHRLAVGRYKWSLSSARLIFEPRPESASNQRGWSASLRQRKGLPNHFDVCTTLMLSSCTAGHLVYSNCGGLGSGQEPWTRSPASAAAVVSASTSV